MYRTLLASTAIAALAAPVSAAEIDTDITAPVKTSTADDGTPSSITITEDGSVTIGSGIAVTMDSDHAVANAGEIAISNADGAIGILAEDGTSGAITNSGSIIIDESYTATDEDNDGDLDGPFAVGSDRFGIRTQGAHSGAITNSGTITVEGEDSAGIWLDGPQTGAFANNGTVSVRGDGSTAIRAGAIDGNVRLAGTVTAIGEDAVGAHFAGDIDGAMVVQGNIGATGYRYTTAPSDTSKLDADDLLQGGSALLIDGDVSGGILLAIRPADSDSNDDDEDNDGIPDDEEGSANVASVGAAPAMVIGATDRDIAIGAVAGSGTDYGLIIDGTVSGSGLYTGVDGNGLQIAGRGGDVSIANGIGIAGTVRATSRDADATALRFGAGASTPKLHVSGKVESTNGDYANTVSTAISIDAGADLQTIANAGSIRATTGDDGTAVAIIDHSGDLTLIQNSGSIIGTGAEEGSGRNIALDLTSNTSGVTINQTAVASGITAPVIRGAVLFGSGDDTLSIADGSVQGTVDFGAGNGSLSLSGDAVQTGSVVFAGGSDAMSLSGSSVFSGTVDFGGGADSLSLTGTSAFVGDLENAGGLALSMDGGALDISKQVSIGSLSVAEGSRLFVTIDGSGDAGTRIDVAGAATFEEDAELVVRLADVETAEGRHVVVSAGSLSGAAGIETNTDYIPFLFKAEVAADAGPNELALDIGKRSAEELELNRSQADAYDAVFASLGNDENIEAIFLSITDGDAFRSAVDMLLPDHAGGAFEGISLGTRAMARQVAEPIGPMYEIGGLSVILGAAGWGANKDKGETAAYDLGGLGFSATGEIATGIGSFGASLSWLWNEYSSGGDNNKIISNTYELAGYWRGDWGGFSAYGRGSIGKSDFDGRRTFTGSVDGEAVQLTANRDWSGTLVTFSGGASFEGGSQFLFFRPAVSVDYVKLDEDGYSDTDGGDGLNLVVEDRSSDELAVNGGLTVGVDLSGMTRRDTNWLRIEGEGGWREIVDGALGSTAAHFVDGDSFTLDPEQRESGWFARLRAMGGNSDFTLGGELGAEDSLGGTAFSVRGTLRMGF